MLASYKPNLYRFLVLLSFLGNGIIYCSEQSVLSSRILRLNEIIASRRDASISATDLPYNDSLFNTAVSICNGDRVEALLTLTFTLLPYNKVPVTIPVIGWRTTIPVYSAPEDEFRKKNEKIPRILFIDTPPGAFGDSDKLAHFFGTALLRYGTLSHTASLYAGVFVEAFEEIFRADGTVDTRDLRTNYLGYTFGGELRRIHSAVPSLYFLAYNLKHFSWIL